MIEERVVRGFDSLYFYFLKKYDKIKNNWENIGIWDRILNLV